MEKDLRAEIINKINLSKHLTLLLLIGLALLSCSFFQDPLIGTWKYSEYCVYESDDCDGNCNYQKFIPIVYSYSSFPIGSQVGVINTIGSDDLIINDDLQGEGFFGTSNFSTTPNTFCFCTSGGSFEAFPGAGSSNYSGTNKASGTYELEEDNGILKLIYYKASKCVQPVTNGLAHHKFFDADSVECIDSNYTWYPSHCAKITFIKQNN